MKKNSGPDPAGFGYEPDRFRVGSESKVLFFVGSGPGSRSVAFLGSRSKKNGPTAPYSSVVGLDFVLLSNSFSLDSLYLFFEFCSNFVVMRYYAVEKRRNGYMISSLHGSDLRNPKKGTMGVYESSKTGT